MTLWDKGPQVQMVAYTHMDAEATSAVGYLDHEDASSADDLAEFAGRTCYLSYDNRAGRTNEEYLQQQIIEHGHYSVLEHASATFYISGVSRSLLTELTRHRHLSFSAQSQRYVDEVSARMIVPPDIAKLDDLTLLGELVDADIESRARYLRLVVRLQDTHGLSRKDARSAARAVLPNMTETTLVVSGNHRTWREVLGKRLAPGADAEIRQLSVRLLDTLYEVAPAIYQDIRDNFYGK